MKTKTMESIKIIKKILIKELVSVCIEEGGFKCKEVKERINDFTIDIADLYWPDLDEKGELKHLSEEEFFELIDMKKDIEKEAMKEYKKKTYNFLAGYKKLLEEYIG